MKKFLILFVCFFLVSCSDNSENDVRKQAADRIAEDQIKVNLNALNNFVESNAGCSMAEFWVEMKQLGRDEKIAYQCQGENLPTGNFGFKTIGNLYIFVSLAIAILGVIVYTVNSFNALKATASHDKRKRQTSSVIIEGIIFGFFIIFFEIVLLAVVSIFTAIADQHIINEEDSRLLLEDNQGIADKRSKDPVFKSVLDYMVCVNSNEYAESKFSPDIHFFQTDDGIALKARFERCDLNGQWLYDSVGIAVSNAYGVATDYKTQQGKAIIEALREYVNSASPYAIRISNGDEAVFLKSKFDESLECNELLTAKNVEEYDYDELAKYSAKVNSCLSEKAMTRLLKVPSFNNNNSEWKSVNVCSGEELQKSNLVDRDSATRKIEACISTNCSDIVNSSSSYACGVALSKYNTIKDDRWKQLLTVYTLNPDRQPDYKSAKRPLNSLSAQFSFLEKRTYFLNDGELVDKISVPKHAGSLSRDKIEKIFLSEYNTLFIESSEEDPLEKLSKIFINKNGFAGTDRFFTCIANLYGRTEKYSCKSFTYERRLAGATMMATAAMLDGTAMLSKPNKAKAKSKKEEIEISNHKGSLESINIDKRILAFVIPFAAGAAGSMGGEDIFGEQYYDIVGDSKLMFGVALLLMNSPELASLFSLISTGLKAAGTFLIYGYELMYAVLIWTIIVGVIASTAIRSAQHKMESLISIGTNTTRNDLDRSPLSLFLEELGIIIISLPIAYYISINILNVILVFIIGDFRQFGEVTLGVAANQSISSTIFALFLAFIIFIILLKQTVGYVNYFREIIIAAIHGKLNSVDLKVQGIDERKSFSSAMKSKQL